MCVYRPGTVVAKLPALSPELLLLSVANTTITLLVYSCKFANWFSKSQIFLPQRGPETLPYKSSPKHLQGYQESMQQKWEHFGPNFKELTHDLTLTRAPALRFHMQTASTAILSQKMERDTLHCEMSHLLSVANVLFAKRWFMRRLAQTLKFNQLLSRVHSEK